MDFSDIAFGVFSGDIGSLSVLFVMFLPFAILYSIVRWWLDR